MDTKDIGNLGEHIAIVHLLNKGITVSRPLGDSAEYDLILDIDGKLKTCQVKSTNTYNGDFLYFGLTTSTKRGKHKNKFYTVDCFALVDIINNQVFLLKNKRNVKVFRIRYEMPDSGAKSKVNLAKDFTIEKYLVECRNSTT